MPEAEGSCHANSRIELLPSAMSIAMKPVTEHARFQTTSSRNASMSLVGIVVTALVLFAISSIITPWLIDSEQTTSTSTSGNSVRKMPSL